MQELHDGFRKPLIHWIQNPASVGLKWHNSTVRSILTNLLLGSYRDFWIYLEYAACAPERLMLHAPPSKMEYKENRELHQEPDYLANITTRRHLTLTTALTIQ